VLADVEVVAEVLTVVDAAVVGVLAGLPHPTTATTTRAASNIATDDANTQNPLLRATNMFVPFLGCCRSHSPTPRFS